LPVFKTGAIDHSATLPEHTSYGLPELFNNVWQKAISYQLSAISQTRKARCTETSTGSLLIMNV